MGVFQPVQVVWHVCLIFAHDIEVNFFCRSDYYVGNAFNWMQDKYIDDVKEQIQSTIGVDITSATEREEFACAVYSMFPTNFGIITCKVMFVLCVYELIASTTGSNFLFQSEEIFV